MDNKYRTAVVLFIMLSVSYCYFFQNPWNWNSVPRVALTLSIIENSEFTIDRFKNFTRDLAYYKGNYYADKAPGMSFMAIPPVAAVRYYLVTKYKNVKWVSTIRGLTPDFLLLEQWATITTAGLIAVLTALAIYFLAFRLGAGIGGAVFAALSFGLATPAWGWATAFFGHVPAGGCLFLGLAAVFVMLTSPGNKKRDIFLGFVSGALLSWAVVIELTSAPVSAMIAIYGLYSARRWGRERFVTAFLPALAGAVLFISPLLLYNYLITGDVFTSLYGYTVLFTKMKEGFFGLTYPKPDVLASLIFSHKYGILWFSPLLLAVPLAFYRLWKMPEGRALSVVLAAAAVYFLLLNSSFFYWTGGGSTGPRYLTPMLPFLCLPLAVLWRGAGHMLKAALLTLFALSFAFTLVCVSVSMTIDYPHDINIITGFVIPLFLNGEKFQFSLLLKSFVSDPILRNYNNLLFLIPLLLFLAACAFYIVRTVRKSEKPAV